MYDERIKRLREVANEQCFIGCFGICDHCKISEELNCAADATEELQDALLLMVLQYCTTDDGLLYNSFMSAGENAFAVLGLKNGQQADPLWDRVLQKPQKEE